MPTKVSGTRVTQQDVNTYKKSSKQPATKRPATTEPKGLKRPGQPSGK